MKFISTPIQRDFTYIQVQSRYHCYLAAFGAVLGYLFLVIAFCLPTNRMRSHLESTPDAFL